MGKLRFVHLMIILAVYESEGKITQQELIGKPPKYEGAINQLMWSTYLLDEKGESENLAYGDKLKSVHTFDRGIKLMREEGIFDPEVDGYELTDLGKSIGAYLSEFNYYKDMPYGATIEDGVITYEELT